MAKKFYAVRHGRKPGVYNSWDICKKQVMGYSGAIYKSFSTLEEARLFIEGGKTISQNSDSSDDLSLSGKEDLAVAYVDGSYDPGSGAYSCGAVLFYQGQEVVFSRKYTDPEMAEMRNVAGEIMGATEVIDYCISRDIAHLVIYHDYEGVARWAEGSWKTNRNGTKAYAKACQEARKHMKLSFKKVKGHSGDKYNDMADALAKKALGLK